MLHDVIYGNTTTSATTLVSKCPQYWNQWEVLQYCQTTFIPRST